MGKHHKNGPDYSDDRNIFFDLASSLPSIDKMSSCDKALSGASVLGFTSYVKKFAQPDSSYKSANLSDVDTWIRSDDSKAKGLEENDFQTAIPVTNLIGSYTVDKVVAPEIIEIDDELPVWEWQFSMFNLENMTVKEVTLINLESCALNELHRSFKRARRDFLRYIAYYNVQDLEILGLDDNALRSLKKAKTPENFDVHIKVPFEYGGTCDFSNLLFIKSHPFHDDIHKFVDMQINSRPLGCRLSKLYVPDYDGRVYLPQDSSSLGGGKGKGDKTSVQGYSEAALQAIAMRTMDRGAKL